MTGAGGGLVPVTATADGPALRTTPGGGVGGGICLVPLAAATPVPEVLVDALVHPPDEGPEPPQDADRGAHGVAPGPLRDDVPGVLHRVVPGPLRHDGLGLLRHDGPGPLRHDGPGAHHHGGAHAVVGVAGPPAARVAGGGGPCPGRGPRPGRETGRGAGGRNDVALAHQHHPGGLYLE